MSTVYRKTLKGIEEVAFNGSGLPMRLVSYLVAIDGQTPDDVLAARNPHLQSLAAVLQGLMEQGFLEAVSVSAQSPGVNLNRTQPVQAMPGAFAPAYAPNPSPGYPPQSAPAFSQPFNPSQQSPQHLDQRSTQMPPQQQGFPAPAVMFPNLEPVKASMVKDVIAILGQDAGPVVAKIRGCNNQSELFALVMGIKKIITVYSSRETAEKFASKYNQI